MIRLVTACINVNSFGFFLKLCISAYAMVTSVNVFALSYCNQEDAQYADFWGNYYDPDEAYEFGRQIQSLVQSKNLAGLFELIDGELENGPRTSVVQTKSFDEVFTDEWRKRVLEDTPPCGPVGWRGFMLGGGHIWYSMRGSKGKIFAFNGAVVDDHIKSEWEHGEGVLGPRCFAYPWPSGDNFEYIAEHFGITEIRDFIDNPGTYLGEPINDVTPLPYPWDDDSKDDISLVQDAEDCALETYAPDNSEEFVTAGNTDMYGSSCEDSYAVVAEAPITSCRLLAPKFDATCKEARVVSARSTCTGGMSVRSAVGLFGLFDLRSGKSFIAPLKFFDSVNDAENYLDDVRGGD